MHPILSDNLELIDSSISSTKQEQATLMFFHIDEPVEFENIHFRVSIAIKGSGTLFCKLVEDENKIAEAYKIIFNQIDYIVTNQEADLGTNIIEEIQNNFNPCDLSKGHSILQAPKYFGAVFIIGKSNYSAIHSVPKTNEEDRIFLFAKGTK